MNLFVGNLSPETSEDQLRHLFSEFGPIKSTKIPLDNATGLPRGFGFVEMEDKFHGYDAIDNLDCTYFMGAIISVKESKPKTQGGGGAHRGGGGFNRNRNFNRQEGGGGGFNRNRSFNSNRSNDRGGNDRGSYNSRGSNYNSGNSYNNGNSYNSGGYNNNNNNSSDKDYNKL